jgi:hypothetical protein
LRCEVVPSLRTSFIERKRIYPRPLFFGVMKFVLFTIVPAGFIGYRGNRFGVRA